MQSSRDSCYKCGQHLPADAAYCPNCGTRLTSPRAEWSYNHPWRNSRKRDEYPWWGAISAAGFLVIIAITIITYPDVFSRVANYFGSFATYGHPVLPNYDLGKIVIFFFNICGIWGLIAAALRFALTNSLARASSDAVGALFSLYIANAFSQFYARAFDGWGLLGTLVVGLAAVIVANALISILLPRRLKTHPNEPSWGNEQTFSKNAC